MDMITNIDTRRPQPQPLRGLLAWIVEHDRRYRERQKLLAKTDAELDDIGVSRATIQGLVRRGHL